jgi:hypothetical protein
LALLGGRHHSAPAPALKKRPRSTRVRGAVLGNLTAQLSAFTLGVLSGAMLLIAVAVAPFWHQLPPAEFRAWFAANAHRIGALMIPLGLAAALTSVAALLVGFGTAGRRGWLALAVAGAVGVAVVTLLVNEPANRLFATPGALADDETSALLARWIMWHRVRVGLGVIGFVAALQALTRHASW